MPTVYSPPVQTYTPLATITLPSATNTVDFESISSSYRDLVLVIEGSATAGGAGFRLRLNGDTGSTYNMIGMRNNGTTPVSPAYGGNTVFLPSDVGLTTDRFMCVVQINDYAQTNKHKPLLVRTDTSDNVTEAWAMRWASTSAVNEINVFLSSQNFSAGTTMSLYAIAS